MYTYLMIATLVQRLGYMAAAQYNSSGTMGNGHPDPDPDPGVRKGRSSEARGFFSVVI